MLTEQIPDEALVEWSQTFIKSAKDRPWFSTKPPMVAVDIFEPKCRCNITVKLVKYDCEDNAGWIYLGQCRRCETIIWSYKEA